jgi:pimeloyl-ACP methyl ester carboxylesterase
LENVKCPVLGLFGEIDDETPASIAVSNMRRGLAKGGNRKYVLKIFPNANHALMLGTKSMAPGVFQTISNWLSQTVRVTR